MTVVEQGEVGDHPRDARGTRERHHAAVRKVQLGAPRGGPAAQLGVVEDLAAADERHGVIRAPSEQHVGDDPTW